MAQTGGGEFCLQTPHRADLDSSCDSRWGPRSTASVGDQRVGNIKRSPVSRPPKHPSCNTPFGRGESRVTAGQGVSRPRTSYCFRRPISANMDQPVTTWHCVGNKGFSKPSRQTPAIYLESDWSSMCLSFHTTVDQGRLADRPVWSGDWLSILQYRP